MKKILLAGCLLVSSFNVECNAFSLPTPKKIKEKLEELHHKLEDTNFCDIQKSIPKSGFGTENIRSVVSLICHSTNRSKDENILIDAINKRKGKSGIDGAIRSALLKIAEGSLKASNLKGKPEIATSFTRILSETK